MVRRFLRMEAMLLLPLPELAMIHQTRAVSTKAKRCALARSLRSDSQRTRGELTQCNWVKMSSLRLSALAPAGVCWVCVCLFSRAVCSCPCVDQAVGEFSQRSSALDASTKMNSISPEMYRKARK